MAVRRELTREAAEAIAIQGLQFLAENPEEIGRFLALSGIGPSDLRTAAAEPGFLVGVLEFFMQNEQLLVSFASRAGLRPTMVAAARYALAGGHEDGEGGW